MTVKVLLVVIDAASPRVVAPAVQTGRLPALQQLAAAGVMHEASVTIFPSITPAATTSIVTGAYPNENGIVGAAWFDEQRNEIAYYGDDFWVIAREGLGSFVNDFLLRLNGDRLRAPTLFELVERTGRRSASLNYLVFRGPCEHEAHVPLALSAIPGVPRRQFVSGPSTLSLGTFVTGRIHHGRKLKGPESLLHRFGMDDESTGELLVKIVGQRALPEFTVAYFADNDFLSHEVGPHAALSAVERVDAMLGAAFDAAGGLERLLEDTLVVVTSDHGHCEILEDASKAVVTLDELRAEFRCAKLGRAWRPEDEIMICPNMRAAQIYIQEPTPERIRRIVDVLHRDPRVDQVIWCAGLTGDDTPGEFVVSSRRGQIQFARGDGPRDDFGTRWTWTGEPDALRFACDRGEIEWREYPNAFERIAGVLDAAHGGQIWATAIPGCEFEVPGGDAHVGGGSHGALHALDSLSPVIAAGPPGAVVVPRSFRSVDIAPLCARSLGIGMRYRVGEPRPGRVALERQRSAAAVLGGRCS